MKILLINPCLRPTSDQKIIPYGLACIATALSNAGYKLDILDIDLYRLSDEEVDKYLMTHSYDIIALGTIISSYKIVKKLCQQVKRIQPDTILVVGNTVATSIPELLLSRNPEVDIAVIGEGDRTIVDVVTTVLAKSLWHKVPGIAFREKDKIVITTPREAIPKMEDIPFPDFTLFDFPEYLKVSYLFASEPFPIPRDQLKVLPVNTARGCPFNCTFCTHAFKTYKYRYYPFKQVVAFFKEYQQRFGVNFLNFWDELTFSSKKRVVELCDEIEKADITVYWSISPRGNLFKQEDLDLLKRCKSLGALSIGGALESGSPEILTAMNKSSHPEEYIKGFIEQSITAQDAGLVPQTSVVFGYPQETKETIRQTIDVCRKARVYPSAGFLLPLPGTPIYRIAREKGLIEDDEEKYLLRIGDRQDLHVNMTQMSNDELTGYVTEGLISLKNELKIPLWDDQVIKTGYYRVAKN